MVHIKDPGKKSNLAIGSSAMAGGGLAEIPAVRRCSWPGKWLGMTTSSRGIDLWLGLGQKWRRRWCMAALVGGDRCSSCFGERAARPGKQATLGGFVLAYQAVGSLRWSGCGLGGKAQRAASNGGRR
jgi:hypothetical protein